MPTLAGLLNAGTLMTPDEFGSLFERFQRSAFRLEARDLYTVPDEREALTAFLGGKDVPPRSPETDSWLALVAHAAASGRTVERVRILTRPPNDYTRFEFAVYPENVAAGETIRVIERAALQSADRTWSDDDFWIFDDETVARLDYDSNGRFIAANRVDSVAPYLFAKQRALAISTDLASVSL